MAVILPVFFLIFHCVNAMNNTNSNPFNIILEQKLENLFSDYAVDVAKWLENYNDGNFKNSDIGRLFRYEDMKPKFSTSDKKGRSMKKMSMAMMPLIFHLGVSSTWIMLTAIMTAKSVAIGILLLIFKVASSSAKIASYFTALKAKHHQDWSWSPHHDHHDTHPEIPIHSYSPEWSPPIAEEYKTIPDVHESNEIPFLDD